MYLRSLTLKGFKSFAESTTLELEPGVTVVVGPNGSGKSNVVDAIAWVLGAQAPSAVRSQKMDDVIFAGTAKRAALGRAEVSLTIDNSSGILPIEFSEVTITRTLFRSGDSEYALNGVPCRLLDIQELLSDSGVGRQQHVIIGQGQIDAVLNARPEDRRLIIEEAAGVLKYRKRKEKSERRLAATEGNLLRLQDLLREVRRQLRPLERQAEAARKHGDVVAELTALRIFTAGRELDSLKKRLEATAAQRSQLAATERDLKSRLAALDTEVLATEARLSAMGGDDLGDSLAQFESLYERARGLGTLLAERRRNLDRERNASIDQGVIATLEAESARLRAELEQVEREAAATAPQLAALAEAEAALAAERAAFEQEWGDGVPAPSGQAAEVRGELAALRAAVERAEADHARVQARLAALDDKQERLGAEAERLRAELAGAEQAELPLVESLDAAERARVEREASVAAAEDARRDAESELHAWQARAEALALALDEARSKAGAERLAGIDGVIGTLLDVVEIDPGWEAAFEAAAGDALAAVVVDSPATARQALHALHGEALTGAVLALGADRPVRAAPAVGEPLRRHVRGARAEVDRLLDTLIGAAVVVDGGWAEAVDVALAHPEAIVVTADGDRFGETGWRIGSAGAGATGAALEDAQRRAEQAALAVEEATVALAAARHALEEARRVEAELSRSLDDNDGRLSAAADGLQRVETDRRDAATESDALRAHLAELDERLDRERARIGELERLLPALEADEQAYADAGRRMGEARSRLEERAAEVGALRADLDVRAAATSERRQFLSRRLAEVEQRLQGAAAEREQAAQRRAELDARQLATDRLAAFVAERSTGIETVLQELRERRRRQSEAARAVAAELDGLRRERAEAETGLAELRERMQRLEIDEAETRLRIETAVEALRRDLDTEPAVAIEAACPPLPEGVTPAARIRELERELRIMGPINPLALQEYEALQERHQFLQDQLDDVKESRRELAKIIKAIDGEIVNVFAAAFADVAANFEQLFATLFPGGTGRLRLTDPENLLATGIEVEAKPSGKNVKKLSLLSGGERSLTALAFLFAVFRSRPSPFYVMDEVEAALDDINLHRFLGLVDEFRREAQLIIVSHQKRTMEAADCLYGVTMQPGGSSRVVSEKVAAGA
ncbi:chromosome segregation protein SMC [Rhabdothermincola sp.]|uniref:chromosome segregation protein SMC n=1 Tax=Rhabdothermincola sp. TaxID=2820405 RepID=UPI002FE06207